MKRLVAVILSGLLLGTAPAAREPVAKPTGQLPRLDDVPGFHGMRTRWAGLMDEFDVPGMAIAVVKDRRIAAIETFGMRVPGSLGAAGKAPTADTMYYIASITKTYLATAVCALADDGQLSLDDPVQKYLPRFKLPKAPEGSAEKITVRDLLSHRAGLVDGQPVVVLDAFTGEINEDRYFKWLSMMRLKGETVYSNIHFTLLGRVVESASGKPWQEYLVERVLKPADLNRTTSSASDVYDDADFAMPMELVDGKWCGCRLRKTDRTMHAAGGLAASAHDAARFLILHLNDGAIDGKRVILAARAKEMRALQGPLPKKLGAIRIMEGYGLGWQTGTFHGTPLCAHGGGYAGTTTYYAFLPEKGCGFAVLMNAGGVAAGMMDVITVDILDRLMEGDERIDVVEAYRKRVSEQKRTFAAHLAKFKSELEKPLELTRPVGEYAGRFLNDDLGTLTIAVDGKRLTAKLGDCELDVATAGVDALKVLGPTLDGAAFKFIVPQEGEVAAVRLEGAGQAIVFKK